MEASRPVQLAQFQGHQSTTAFKPKLHFSCLWFHFQSPMPHSSQSRSSRSRRNTKHTAGCRCDTSYCTVKKKKKKMPLSRETTVRFCCIGIVEVHGNGSTQPRKKKKKKNLVSLAPNFRKTEHTVGGLFEDNAWCCQILGTL